MRDPEERRRIREIEDEEWRHRVQVGEMLAALGAGPSRLREVLFWTIGRTLGALCHVSGWLAPMWGAGRLESRNVREYEVAAQRAMSCGRGEWLDCLLTMAEVEWEHEAYFRARVLSHRLGRRLPLWTAPPPKHTIHCEPGEALGDTLRRELDEELGVRATAFEEIAVLGEPDPARHGPAEYHVFAVTAWDGEPAIRNGEHSELRWLGLECALELPLAHPEAGRLLRRALAAAP